VAELLYRPLSAPPLAVVGDDLLSVSSAAMAPLAHTESDTPFRLVAWSRRMAKMTRAEREAHVAEVVERALSRLITGSD
jgi:hypothetical protein